MNRFKWTLHNLIGHPLMEILNLLGLTACGTWVHDATLPKDADE